MNVLMIGRDKGAWQMRGRQLGAAIGATVSNRPTRAQIDAADVVVLVKRAPWYWLRELQGSKPALVWDVLDFWSQPNGNAQTEAELTKAIEEIRRLLAPVVVGATQAMATALGGVYLPHHSRAGLAPTSARERLRVVGYDGNTRYLGRWQPALERACARLGLTFVLNPDDLRQVDLFVAFRDAEWDGWPCRQWKSGVKYVNAIAAGRPILTQRCAAFEEIAPCGSVVESPDEVEAAIVEWQSYERRHEVVTRCQSQAKRYTLEAVAKTYRQMLAGVCAGVA